MGEVLAKNLLSPKVHTIGFYILLTSFQKLFRGPWPHTEHFLENMPITQKWGGLAKNLLSPKVHKIGFYILLNSFQKLYRSPWPHTEHFLENMPITKKWGGLA